MKYDIQTILFVINSIHHRIEKTDNIGLFMSGGFDSSILSYIVFKYINDNNIDKSVTVYVVPRHDDSINHVNRVLNSFAKNINYTYKVVGNPNLHHSMQVFSGIQEAKNSNNVLWIADTKTPSELPNGPTRPKIIKNNEYHPFLTYYKTITIQIACYFDILNEISTISHTCTESLLLRCNKCWQCKERSWAFTTLNLIDIGEM